MSAAAAIILDRLGGFWAWWLSELRAALPEALFRWRAPPDRADIRVGRDETLIDRFRGREGERLREERPLEALDESGWEELAGIVGDSQARLILSPPDVFVLTLDLPAEARGRIREAVRLQLAQAAPAPPERLFWNCRLLSAEGRRLTAVTAMALEARADALRSLFTERGLDAPSVVAIAGEEEIELLPSEASRAPARREARIGYALAALLLASAPLTTWAAASLLARSEEGRAAALREQVGPKLAEERRAARDERVRRALNSVFELPSATATLEALALALPDSAFATSAERQFDGTFRFEAQAADRAALEEALSGSPLLSGLNPLDSAPAEEGGVRLSYRGPAR